MIVPQSISQTCSIISSIKLLNVSSSWPILKYSPPKYKSFQKFKHYKYTPTPHKLLSDKESFCHKISLKSRFRFYHDNFYVNNMERPFFPTETEARRELARVGLISKHHCRPQMIQFDVLDDPAGKLI